MLSQLTVYSYIKIIQTNKTDQSVLYLAFWKQHLFLEAKASSNYLMISKSVSSYYSLMC